MKRVVPILMVAGVVSLLLSLLLGGFIVYQWVLACEATAASIALFAYYLRTYQHDSRASKWPPLLPLSVIAASGGVKSFFVATGADTPVVLVVVLLVAVVWFAVASLKIWKAEKAALRGDG